LRKRFGPREIFLLLLALVASAVVYDLSRGFIGKAPTRVDPTTKRRADAIFQRSGGDLSHLSKTDFDIVQVYISMGGARPANLQTIPEQPHETLQEKMQRVYVNSWGDPTKASGVRMGPNGLVDSKGNPMAPHNAPAANFP
jgi:hypothetical protein